MFENCNSWFETLWISQRHFWAAKSAKKSTNPCQSLCHRTVKWSCQVLKPGALIPCNLKFEAIRMAWNGTMHVALLASGKVSQTEPKEAWAKGCWNQRWIKLSLGCMGEVAGAIPKSRRSKRSKWGTPTLRLLVVVWGGGVHLRASLSLQGQKLSTSVTSCPILLLKIDLHAWMWVSFSLCLALKGCAPSRSTSGATACASEI